MLSPLALPPTQTSPCLCPSPPPLPPPPSSPRWCQPTPSFTAERCTCNGLVGFLTLTPHSTSFLSVPLTSPLTQLSCASEGGACNAFCSHLPSPPPQEKYSTSYHFLSSPPPPLVAPQPALPSHITTSQLPSPSPLSSPPPSLSFTTAHVPLYSLSSRYVCACNATQCNAGCGGSSSRGSSSAGGRGGGSPSPQAGAAPARRSPSPPKPACLQGFHQSCCL